MGDFANSYDNEFLDSLSNGDSCRDCDEGEIEITVSIDYEGGTSVIQEFGCAACEFYEERPTDVR